LLVASKLCGRDHILKIISKHYRLPVQSSTVYLAVNIGADFKQSCGREMRPSDICSL
jgi:hypothetical protein